MDGRWPHAAQRVLGIMRVKMNMGIEQRERRAKVKEIRTNFSACEFMDGVKAGERRGALRNYDGIYPVYTLLYVYIFISKRANLKLH